MITQQTDIEFLSGLAKSSVDLCLTDPPYIISKDSGMDRLLRSEDVDEKYGRKYAYATDYGDWDKDFTINDLDQSIYLIKRALTRTRFCGRESIVVTSLDRICRGRHKNKSNE